MFTTYTPLGLTLFKKEHETRGAQCCRPRAAEGKRHNAPLDESKEKQRTYDKRTLESAQMPLTAVPIGM